jgi:putative PIN family toxin of toxin-antitoxin system
MSAADATASLGATLVLDTNIVLDLLVFSDQATHPVEESLSQGRLQWLTTDAMRDELARVLAYPKITARLSSHGLEAAKVLADLDSRSRRVAPAAKAPVTCKDADDQKFIDLAVAHRALLLSKDHAVLCMARRLAALQVTASAFLPLRVS